MPTRRFPLLRSRITGIDTYVSPQGGPPTVPGLPKRNPKKFRAELLAQLSALEEAAVERTERRDPDATREIVAIRPEPGSELAPEQLDDARGDVRLVGEDPDTGVVLLDAPGPALASLRAKIDAFADDSLARTKTTPDGREVTTRANERAVAPIAAIALAAVEDLAGVRLRTERLVATRAYWFEIGCRGGYRRPPEETARSREQLRRQLQRIGRNEAVEEFVAPEQVFFFVRATPRQLGELVERTDCIFEADVAPPEVRDWRLLADQEKSIRDFHLSAPSVNAPAVVLLDSGVATRHPLLEPALLPCTSVVPGYESPDDTFGHGTRMAGVALYEDLGAALEAGQYTPSNWIQSARLLVADGAGTASEANRHLWPALTEQAVRSAELADRSRRPRAFCLAVARPLDQQLPTLWSNAIDQIAFHEGQGRLVVACAGNAPLERWLALAQQYPLGQLGEKIHEPGQAPNALTVGAYTERTHLPPDDDYAEMQPVVKEPGGISPYTTTGVIARNRPIKPDVVMEGGNLAVGNGLTDDADTLLALTTGHRLQLGYPLSRLAMTSEASARAARLAASIWAAQPSLRAETVRGLVVHSASWTQEMLSQFNATPDRLMACGYGVPDLSFARECARDRATIVIESEMPSAVEEEVPRKRPPKRPSTKPTERHLSRKAKLYEVPIPESLQADDHDPIVELRVTLSYFGEPNSFRRRTSYGLELKWDMQGPQESRSDFLERINEVHRPVDSKGRRKRAGRTRGFEWDIGSQMRNRGTVQSDRWSGPLSLLVGDKLIAVIPVLGWWAQRRELRSLAMPFSLIVTVRAPGAYSAIKPLVDIQVAPSVEV